jgi:hypothetical protein
MSDYRYDPYEYNTNTNMDDDYGYEDTTEENSNSNSYSYDPDNIGRVYHSFKPLTSIASDKAKMQQPLQSKKLVIPPAEINDARLPSEFKGFTFSKFKKADVRKELLNSLLQAKIEPACYWSAELICAGHFEELWDIIIHFYSKHIHSGNPKMAVYLDTKVGRFKDIVHNGYAGYEIRLRNNDKIRQMFCEIMCLLCDAKRKHTFDTVKIKSDYFDIAKLSDKLKAPNVLYSELVFINSEDPKELFIAINELVYHLTVDNLMEICFWIEWIIEYDNYMRSRKQTLKCGRRSFVPVESKLQMEVVWMLWDIFLKVCDENINLKNGRLIKSVVKSLLNLFCLRFTVACVRKRKSILYFVASILVEGVNINEEIIRSTEKEKMVSIMTKINLVYDQMKKNEEKPSTDYLFTNVQSSNLEKTIQQLEQINSLGESFIPRIE